MKFIADLHIHSKYSRATSKLMVLEELDRWADDKGILVMATGDFTHPEWFKEIREKLEPAEPGLFKLKSQYKQKTIKDTLAQTRFFLSTEISSIYSRDGKTYRNHNLVFAPDMETVEKINTQLGWVGNLKSDGRPILGLDARELAKIVLNTEGEAVIVPAHIWTPWFSMFGSMSGFDSIEECFGEYAKDIFAGETGLSSDPLMNWRLSQLDRIALKP
jgi:DNA helicase-2/ATP-dependent DNA helicase PcrA